MLNLLWILLGWYAVGMLLPFCYSRQSNAQIIATTAPAIAATGAGIVLGLLGLTSSDPIMGSLASTIPLLTFAIRIDPLAAFFLLTISLAGLAASIYAIGYLRHFERRASIPILGSLFNGFLCSMTLVVLADNGFFFLIAWELMSLLSYALFASELQIITALGSSGLPSEWAQPNVGFPIVVLLLCSLVAFGGLLYRITGMAWDVAPQDIVPGEQWSVGHVPIILLGAVLVGFCWALPPPLLQLFEAAFTVLVNQ